MISAASISHCANGAHNSFPMAVQEIRDTRLRNLAILVQEFGTAAALAEKIGSDPAYLSQLLNGWRGRSLGTKLARRMELAAQKPSGWMDSQHPELWNETEMGKAAGRPLIQTSHKAAQLTWLETEQSKLSEGSLGAVMQLVSHLRSLEKDGERTQDIPPLPRT